MTTLCPSVQSCPIVTSASTTTFSPMTTPGATCAFGLTDIWSPQATMRIGCSKLHRRVGFHRLVHGRDKFQSFATLTTLKHIRLSGGQRVEDRVKERLVTKSVDTVWNVACLLNSHVLRTLFDECPCAHLVDSEPGYLDLSLLAQDRDGTFQVLWVSTGRRLEGSESAGLELPCRYRSVLSLHVMKKTARCCVDGGHRPAKPLHEVHVVDGLVGDTATVLDPCAPPRCLIIILLCPVPPDPRRDHQDTSEPAFIQRVLEQLDRTVEPVLLHSKQPDVGFASCLDHCVGIRQPQCHRLLHDDVAAKPLHDIDRHTGMVATLGTDVHNVDRFVLQHVAVLGVPRHAKLLANCFGFGRHQVAHTGQPRLRDLGKGADMLGGDTSAPYERESHWALHCLSVPSPSLKSLGPLCLTALRVSTMSCALSSTMT